MTGAKSGLWAALAAFLAVAAYGVAQALQIAGALRPPGDAVAIDVASLCIAPAYFIAILALEDQAPASGRMWARGSALFAGLYVTFALLVYGVQLAVAIPYRSDPGTAFLAVYPHSLFWTIDALAYFCMAASCGLAGLSLPADGTARQARTWLLAHAAITPLIGFAYFYPHFSPWVLLAGSPWIVTASGALLSLAALFYRRLGS